MSTEPQAAEILNEFGLWLQRWAAFVLARAGQDPSQATKTPTADKLIVSAKAEAEMSASSVPPRWLERTESPGPPSHWLEHIRQARTESAGPAPESGQMPLDTDSEPAPKADESGVSSSETMIPAPSAGARALEKTTPGDVSGWLVEMWEATSELLQAHVKGRSLELDLPEPPRVEEDEHRMIRGPHDYEPADRPKLYSDLSETDGSLESQRVGAEPNAVISGLEPAEHVTHSPDAVAEEAQRIDEPAGFSAQGDPEPLENRIEPSPTASADAKAEGDETSRTSGLTQLDRVRKQAGETFRPEPGLQRLQLRLVPGVEDQTADSPQTDSMRLGQDVRFGGDSQPPRLYVDGPTRRKSQSLEKPVPAARATKWREGSVVEERPEQPNFGTQARIRPEEDQAPSGKERPGSSYSSTRATDAVPVIARSAPVAGRAQEAARPAQSLDFLPQAGYAAPSVSRYERRDRQGRAFDRWPKLIDRRQPLVNAAPDQTTQRQGQLRSEKEFARDVDLWPALLSERPLPEPGWRLVVRERERRRRLELEQQGRRWSE